MPSNDLTGNLAQDVAALIARIDDVQRAVTPEEKAQAELALQAEATLQWAACMERARQRLLDRLKFNAVLREAGEEPPLF